MKRLPLVWAIVLVCSVSAATAFAINLSDLKLDYLETFAGEFAFPNTPEINNRVFGPMFASFLGNAGAPGLPPVVQEVRFSMANIDGPEASQAQAVAVDARHLATNSNVAVRATFDSLLVSGVSPTLAAASVGLGFDPASEVTTPDLALGVSLSRIDLPPVDLWALEMDLVRTDGTFTNLHLQALPAAMVTSITSGAPFDLTIRFDRKTSQVSCSIVAAGQEASSTPVVVPDSAMPITAVSAAVQVLNSDPGGISLGANDSMRVDLKRFEVHARTIPTSVPGLGGGAIAALAGLLLALGALLKPCFGQVARRSYIREQHLAG